MESDELITPERQPSGLTLYPYEDESITLKEMFSVLWQSRLWVGAATSIGAFIAIVVAFWLPNTYTSSALLAPAESSGGAMSSLLKQYGGLASLAGISLPSGGDDSKAGLAKELMKSRAFIADFIERRDILPDLMAADRWDRSSGELVYDAKIYDAETQMWVRDVDPPKQVIPSMLEAHEEFLDILSISENKDTGYVTVSVSHISPIVAQRWVSWLVDDINLAVKSQDVTEANRSIDYLKEQVANTSLAELQSMFFELIQSQTETVMLAQVRPEYVFKTIDPAVVPEKKSKPLRALIIIMGAVLGAMVGILVILARGAIPNQGQIRRPSESKY